MESPADSVYLHSNASGLKEKLATGRTTVLGRAHVPAGQEALQVSRSEGFTHYLRNALPLCAAAPQSCIV